MAYYYKDKLKDAHGELTSYKISGDWQFTVLRYSDFDIAIFENGVPIMDTFAVPLDIYVKETDLNGKRPFEIYTDLLNIRLTAVSLINRGFATAIRKKFDITLKAVKLTAIIQQLIMKTLTLKQENVTICKTWTAKHIRAINAL